MRAAGAEKNDIEAHGEDTLGRNATLVGWSHKRTGHVTTLATCGDPSMPPCYALTAAPAKP